MNRSSLYREVAGALLVCHDARTLRDALITVYAYLEDTQRTTGWKAVWRTPRVPDDPAAFMAAYNNALDDLAYVLRFYPVRLEEFRAWQRSRVARGIVATRIAPASAGAKAAPLRRASL